LLNCLKTRVPCDGLKNVTVESGTPIFGTHNSVVDLDGCHDWIELIPFGLIELVE
jgi:hypothetical protein